MDSWPGVLLSQLYKAIPGRERGERFGSDAVGLCKDILGCIYPVPPWMCPDLQQKTWFVWPLGSQPWPRANAMAQEVTSSVSSAPWAGHAPCYVPLAW